MKIIQIIVKKDEIYGLCDEGQLWRFDLFEEEPSLSYWSLIEIQCFVHHRIDDSFNNELKINLTPQAEKLLGKKKVGLLEGLVTKHEGKPTMVSESDNRPDISSGDISDFD